MYVAAVVAAVVGMVIGVLLSDDGETFVVNCHKTEPGRAYNPPHCQNRPVSYFPCFDDGLVNWFRH